MQKDAVKKLNKSPLLFSFNVAFYSSQCVEIKPQKLMSVKYVLSFLPALQGIRNF